MSGFSYHDHFSRRASMVQRTWCGHCLAEIMLYSFRFFILFMQVFLLWFRSSCIFFFCVGYWMIVLFGAVYKIKFVRCACMYLSYSGTTVVLWGLCSYPGKVVKRSPLGSVARRKFTCTAPKPFLIKALIILLWSSACRRLECYEHTPKYINVACVVLSQGNRAF